MSRRSSVSTSPVKESPSPRSSESSPSTEHFQDANKDKAARLDVHSIDSFFATIQNPKSARLFQTFLEKEHSDENLEIWTKIERFKALQAELQALGSSLIQEYIVPGAVKEVNLPSAERDEAIANMEELAKANSLPVFQRVQQHVEQLLFLDPFPRFVRHQISENTRIWATQTQKTRVVGLGDCFCITDTSLEDNPIIFASDAFPAVTGYTREEIIPHNCRFLQGDFTNRAVVARLKDAIQNKRQCTELLLNYKKDGTPFWNLLLITPLCDPSGQVKHFLGGQMDVTANYMTTLGIPVSCDDANERATNGTSQVREMGLARRIFRRRTWGSRNPDGGNSPPRPPGVEAMMVDDSKNLSEQMDELESAFSKFLVIEPKTSKILFSSLSADRLIYPSSTSLPSSSVGQPFPSFLLGPATKKSAKSELKRAYREGKPVSVDVVPPLYEEGVTIHLTPLKDEKGSVGMWVAVVAECAGGVVGPTTGMQAKSDSAVPLLG